MQRSVILINRVKSFLTSILYLFAVLGFDTAENEPFNFHNCSSLQGSDFHRAVVSEVFGCENDCGFRSYSYTAVLNHEATCQYVSSGPGASTGGDPYRSSADPYRRFRSKLIFTPNSTAAFV